MMFQALCLYPLADALADNIIGVVLIHITLPILPDPPPTAQLGWLELEILNSNHINNNQNNKDHKEATGLQWTLMTTFRFDDKTNPAEAGVIN